MTVLGDRIAAIVRREGPIGLDRYWNLALFDRDHGYYATRDPFGASGDFVTAPEVSQMFGELLGVWVLSAWRSLGRPSPFVLAEIGPGRGTLMADMLRTIARLGPDCLKAARVTLVETSDRLARLQAERLASFDLPIRHRRRVEEIEPLPLLLLANEVFDAVAIRQFVMAEDGWRERCIGQDAEGRLAFVLMPYRSSRAGGDGPPSPASGRRSRQGDATRGVATPIGAILETSPERDALAASIGARIARFGGAALMIDYGHAESGFGDTLQAVRNHAFADPLMAPGEADLTSHIDFAALSDRFRAGGLAVAPVIGQGEFLARLGLKERAEALGRGRTAEQRQAIAAAFRRLSGTGASDMGALFKVLAVASIPLPMPPFGAPPVD